MSTLPIVEFNSYPRMYCCEKTWSWSPPGFYDYDYWLVLSGVGQLVLNGDPHELRGGVGFVFSPGDALRATHDPARPLRVFSFHFSATQPPLLPACDLPVQSVDHDLALLEQLAAQAEWPLNENTRSTSLAMLAAATLLARHALPSNASPDESDHLRACALSLQRSPGQRTTISELARNCGMSEGHFSRCFKREFGSSPTRYRQIARIERACQLLRETRMTLVEIAEAVGFGDPMHFSRSFRKHVGIPPGAYRSRINT